MTTTEKIHNLITDLLGVEEPLSKNLDLKGDLNASPEEIRELFLALEEEFPIETTESEQERTQTVGDIVNLVKDKLDEIGDE